MDHLFFDCPSVTCRWFFLGIVWADNHNVHQRIFIAKQAFNNPFFMDIFMIGAWCLWKERNDYIFNRKPPCLATWKVSFKARVLDHLVRIKPNLHSSIKLWLQAL
jgi:hypothetical protein